MKIQQNQKEYLLSRIRELVQDSNEYSGRLSKEQADYIKARNEEFLMIAEFIISNLS